MQGGAILCSCSAELPVWGGGGRVVVRNGQKSMFKTDRLYGELFENLGLLRCKIIILIDLVYNAVMHLERYSVKAYHVSVFCYQVYQAKPERYVA